jgi:zinc protease
LAWIPLAALAIPAVGLTAGAPKPNLDLKVDPYSLILSDYCFPSGLRILFQEDHSQPIVNITQVIDRGSDADPIGLEGVAHVIEHLWFRSYAEGELKVWDQLAELGASINAYTADDVTTYLTIGPVSSMGAILDLEARRLMGAESVAHVTQTDVNLEREIARNELRMRYENTGTSGLYYLMGKLFPEGHPYARLGIGTHDSLDNITLDDVQAFTAEHYVPANATMLVIGDFDLKDSWKFIDEHFPMELLQDPANPDAELELTDCTVRIDTTQVPPEPPPPVDQSISYHKAGVEVPTILLAWSLPAGYRTGHTDMMLAGTTLSIAINRYLNPDWDPSTDNYEDLDSAGCWITPEEHATIATCWIEVGSGKDPEEVLEDALDGLYHQWNPNDRILYGDYFHTLGKYQNMAYLFNSVETVASLFSERGASAAVFTHFTSDPAYFSRSMELFNDVDSGRIAALAEKYLNRKRVVSVILEPYEEGDILIDSSDQAYKGKPYEGVVETQLDLSTVDADLLREITLLPDLTKVSEFELENGLTVVLYPHGDAPIVRMELTFEGGTAGETSLGLADFAWDFTDHYLDGRTNTPLRMGGDWSLGYGYTETQLGISGSSANLEGLMWMLRTQAEQHSDPSYVQVEYKKEYFDDAIKAVRYNRKFPESWVSWIQGQRLLGAEFPLVDTWDEFEIDEMRSYNKSMIKDWNRTVYRPDNATLFVVGRFDRDRAEALVRTWFEDWSNPGAAPLTLEETPSSPPPIPERQIIVLNKSLVSQTSVSLACQVTPATRDNDALHEILGSVLSEMAWDALREQSGVSYGAYSYVNRLPGGTALLTSGALVQNDSAGVAAKTFLDQAYRVQSGDFAQDLIPLMKVTVARNSVLGQQTSSQMTGRLQEPYLEGWGWDWITEYPDRLGAVTLEDVQNALDPCIGHEVVVMLGPTEIITPQLDELGLSYEIFDWDTERKTLWEAHDPRGYAKAKKKADKAEAKAAKKEAKGG